MATACSPSPADPATSMPGSSSSSRTRPSRTTVWSSTTRILVSSLTVPRPVPRPASRRHPEGDAEPLALRPGLQGPTDQLRALPHADQPVAAALDLQDRLGRAGVGHLQPDGVAEIAQRDARAGAGRVLADVGERLL